MSIEKFWGAHPGVHTFDFALERQYDYGAPGDWVRSSDYPRDVSRLELRVDDLEQQIAWLPKGSEAKAAINRCILLESRIREATAELRWREKAARGEREAEVLLHLIRVLSGEDAAVQR